jgi:serine/threonine protein kinase
VSAPQPGIVEAVGPYRLIRAIGAGGSARIDLACIDRAYGFVRHVVVKRPLEHLRGDATVAASLRREARLGGQLRHPNLVAVLDAGSHAGYDYLVLEYIHGTSLRDLMQTEIAGQVRSVPLAVALGIVIDLARGLHEAHQLTGADGEPLGLVHRDVSPGNVLLGLDGSVKIADFGIAKETRVTTLSGSMNGTVTYMAPEQCRGHAIDRRAGEWALGVILYELVTRQRLFWADNDVASLHRVISNQVTRPRKLDPSIAPQLEDIILTALSQDPQGRFATTKELASALEGFAADRGLVVGARMVARAIEQVVGARAAPWNTATHPAPSSSPAAEASLVTVIENELEVDPEPLLATFGPADEIGAEEGSLARVIVAAPSRRRRIGLMIGVAAMAVGIWAILAVENAPPSVRPPLQRTAPLATTPTAPAPVPVPVPAPVPVPVPTPVGLDPESPSHTVTHLHHRPHVTQSVAAGSNTAMAAESPPMTGATHGSAAPPVEWKPSLLLPSDRTGATPKTP